MARQASTPVPFSKSVRKDTAVLMSSARAGVVVPAGYFPLLPGDSCSGSVGIDVQLKEMPKPLLNGVTARFQAWCVPKDAFPQYSGSDELRHAMTGHVIKALGSADRTPPPFFSTITGATLSTALNSAMFKILGIHVPTSATINTDLVDAFALVNNFRRAAHSPKIPRWKYAAEDIAIATSLPPAFWPSSRFAHVVPDYERALVVGSLDLDVIAGQVPVKGISRIGGIFSAGASYSGDASAVTINPTGTSSTVGGMKFNITSAGVSSIFADMAAQTIGVSLNDIDMARKTQAFAKARAAMDGADATGFDNGDSIIALLMQGLDVPTDEFRRPWLLASKIVGVGMVERNATDGASLDKSVTLGRASATLSLNVPQLERGGIVIFTIEVLPERIDERMSDEYLFATNIDHLPNALRDVQRTEPVDIVTKRRIDVKHSTPDGLYGYEPMNFKWNRDFTRCGGVFYQPTPGAGWTENRAAIWQTEIVNPEFGTTHYLAPSPFPHDVFSDQLGDAFEFVTRHAVSIVGLTQMGDPLMENSDDYVEVVTAG